MLSLKRGRLHVSESCFAQLTSNQRQRAQPVALRGMTAIAIASAEFSQRVRQVIHCIAPKSVAICYVCPFAESKTVSVYANSPKRDPRRARARRSARLLPRMRRPRRFLLEAQAGEAMDDDADAWMNTSFGVGGRESRVNRGLAHSDGESRAVNASSASGKGNGRVNRTFVVRSPAAE
jgi:hypothetical protein